MKLPSLRIIALACLAFLLLGTFAEQATAANINIGVQVGGPPPPPRAEARWARPYRGAVWIAGHHEWINGRWVWVGGYYTYPPRRGGVWVPGHYNHGYWRPGHWN